MVAAWIIGAIASVALAVALERRSARGNGRGRVALRSLALSPGRRVRRGVARGV